jgi:hypothetical protein
MSAECRYSLLLPELKSIAKIGQTLRSLVASCFKIEGFSALRDYFRPFIVTRGFLDDVWSELVGEYASTKTVSRFSSSKNYERAS